MERIVGIDPGLHGAFCIMTMHHKVLTPEEIIFEKFPLIGENEIDFQKLTEIFSHFHDCQAVLEKVSAMPGQGVCSMFKFGRVYGAIQALLASSRIPHEEVRPQEWQRELFSGVPELHRSNGKKDTKRMAKIQVARLFPSLSFKSSHDGFVDALLLAEWGRRRAFRSLHPSLESLGQR